ncbi:MAG TPA: phosphodiester glycosidase family protein [Candidatus Dormibacteraeota bacterium]|nr:phosphodiester glycosidase family protein [Candidatus Dormibacteraeota bacterium]
MREGRGHRGVLLRTAAGVVTAAALLVAAQPFVALSAPAGSVPSFGVDVVSKRAEVTWTVVDPFTTPIEAAVVQDGSSRCFGGGDQGNRCFEHIGSMVDRHHAAAGFTANYNNGVDILGLVVVDHHAWTTADPHTTSLCVGEAISGATRPAVTITKDADAVRCRTAVSGERVVADRQVSIEGMADDGRKGAFWWSVEHTSPVQRTVVGIKQDGSLLVAVVSARTSRDRNGMSIPDTARWLIDHGVVNAIALDGGHQAEAYVAGRGSIVPLQAGEPGVQVSLLLGHTVPVIPAPPVPAPVPPVPAPAPVAPAPAPALATPAPAPRPTPTPRGPVPGTGVLGSVVLPRLPESGALPITGGAGGASGAAGGPGGLPWPATSASGGGTASSGGIGGLTAW